LFVVDPPEKPSYDQGFFKRDAKIEKYPETAKNTPVFMGYSLL
jgi:hypothetical protein